jgi:hypothetical protein
MTTPVFVLIVDGADIIRAKTMRTAATWMMNGQQKGEHTPLEFERLRDEREDEREDITYPQYYFILKKRTLTLMNGNGIAGGPALTSGAVDKYNYNPSHNDHGPMPLKWFSDIPDADPPSKDRNTDTHWKVTLVDRTDNRTEDTYNTVEEFNTHITFIVPPKYYLEVIGSPDLAKAGYMIPGGKLIINPLEYNSLVVPLLKFTEDSDIPLPVDYIYVIPKRIDYLHIQKDVKLNQNQTPMGMMNPMMNMGYPTSKLSTGGQSVSRSTSRTPSGHPGRPGNQQMFM